MIKYHLTKDERAEAKEAAVRRRTESHDVNRRVEIYGTPPWGPLDADIIGIEGEMVAAKPLGIKWTWSRFREPDLAGRVEVRTALGHGRRLIIHPDDRDDLPFVLVTRGLFYDFIVWGWIYAREGKRQEWWETQGRSEETKDGGYSFFVPVDVLHPIKLLREMLRGEDR